MIGSDFTCNICGARGIFEPKGDWREAASCRQCGSSVRARQLVHCLTLRIFGQSRLLGSITSKNIHGVGLSDFDGLAYHLAGSFAYTNSFYHQEPRLDICAPAPNWIDSVDFMTSSDVFEHVPTPVERAFKGAYDVLRRGGILVLTVPFDDRPVTTEHFPNVRDFRLLEFDGEWLLVGRTPQGSYEVHRNLIFHGGPGTTVEVRFFSLGHVIALLEQAGFTDVQVHGETVPEFGIFPPHTQGLPITARKR